MARSGLWGVAIASVMLAGLPAVAQQAGDDAAGPRPARVKTTAAAKKVAKTTAAAEPVPAKKPAKDPGTPLSTIMNTHLYADVPEVKDFVRESRPAPETLDYQPITPQVPGSDPVRPKPRTTKELGALEQELDRAIVRNNQAGNALNRHVKAAD